MKYVSADAVEQLCDEIVFIDKSTLQKPFVVYPMDNISTHDLMKCHSVNKYLIIYGAIWYENGLKYVAKLNKKGKWILL